MKFKSITINNLFSYYGKIKFDFSDFQKPISLIIGENGFGKTSFINSVKIALHGITKDLLQIGELSLSKQEYILGSSGKNFSGIFNRIAKDEGKNKPYVLIEIEDGSLYRLKREFSISNSTYSEKLTVQDFENESFMYDYDAQDFINYKISPTLAKFFFFDGEKIQTIADFSKDDFRQMLEDVLELNIYDQLINDCENVIKKINKHELSQDLQETITKKELKIKKIVDELNLSKENLIVHEETYKSLKTKEDALEKKLKKLEIRHKEELEDLENTLIDLSLEKEKYLASFKESSYIHLPLLLNKQLQKKVSDDISQNYKGNISIPNNIIEIKKKEFLSQIKSSDKESIEKIFDNVFSSKENKQSVVFADSIQLETQYQQMKEVDLSHIINKLIYINDKIRDYKINIENIKHQIQNNKKEYQDDFQKIKTITQNVGKEEEKIDSIKIHIDRLSTLKKEIENEISKISIQEHKSSLAKIKTTSLVSTIEVAQQMKIKIKEDKREMLEKSINIKFNLLKKEGYEADKIVLDNDFNINVYDKKERAMDILSSSSGQKQIIATALIWGISEYISEEIPMIIDTPLGRLDEKNQSLILNQFYPNTSSQVIILPTPSELRHEGFKSLENDISQIFKLSNKGSATSVVKQKAVDFFNNRQSK